jgi:uncharacterized protein (TIGR03437 family)
MAQPSSFLLGIDYSEWTVPNATQIATDSSGAIYILSAFTDSYPPGPSWVTKISADGKTVLWQNRLAFAAGAMVVDPNGGVYVAPSPFILYTSFFVAKLSADGTGLAWQTPSLLLADFSSPRLLAADSQGRAYVTALDSTDADQVIRLNQGGSALDYTAQVAGRPSSIAVDASGAAFLTGLAGVADPFYTVFIARLAPDGSPGFYTMIAPGSYPVVAVDPQGDAAVAFSGENGEVIQHFDSTGALTTSTAVGSGGGFDFVLNADGNAYFIGAPGVSQLIPVKNTLATCPSSGQDTLWLSILAPDGSLLQRTYIQGDLGTRPGPFIALGPNSTVFLAGPAAATFTPTQDGPFQAGSSGASFLLRLSPNANAQTYPLACLGNAATYNTDAIAPGEIVTLFGNGLGPQQGMQTQASPWSPFPKQAGSVEVTFDGTPAPLLWVQDAQINVVAPWSLTPGQTTQVCVSNGDVKTNCLTWPVAQIDPGVFTVDGTHAAALNQDGTVNSADHPAPVGSIVSVFATGLGPITPPQADGTLVGLPLPTNVLPVGVEAYEPEGSGNVITPFVVTYAGPAPYLVAGVSQINFQIAPYCCYLYLTVSGSIDFTQNQIQIYVASQ